MDILDKFGARTMDILHKWYTQVAPFSISARYSCSAWSNQSSFTLKSLYSNIFHENHDKHKFGEGTMDILHKFAPFSISAREQWTYSTSGILKQLLFRFPLDILVQHGRISLVSHSKVFIRIYFMRTMINTSLEREQWTYYTSGILKQLLFRFPLDILVQHGRISLVSHSKVFIRIYFMRTR